MAIKRDENGRFLPGSVGNPKGRPKNDTQDSAKKKLDEQNPYAILFSVLPEMATRLIDLAYSDNDEVALQATLAILSSSMEEFALYGRPKPAPRNPEEGILF